MENLLHWIDQRAKFKEDQRAIETAYKYQPTSSQPNSKGMNSCNTFKQLSLKEIVDAKLICKHKGLIPDSNVKAC